MWLRPLEPELLHRDGVPGVLDAIVLVWSDDFLPGKFAPGLAVFVACEVAVFLFACGVAVVVVVDVVGHAGEEDVVGVGFAAVFGGFDVVGLGVDGEFVAAVGGAEDLVDGERGA